MDCRVVFLYIVVCLSILAANTEGRTTKIVIHVPYKVKKIKHTHTIYRIVHHHHTHHDHLDHGPSPVEEHEHFHHFHTHEEPTIGQHSQPVGGTSIPELLPDAPLDVDDFPDLPKHLSSMPSRHFIRPYRRQFVSILN
ncbi:unnamed protein product [Parnassius mnemosyne]|uniref:Histidine-rich glycoprotein n=1 Tax=Parnassius mnemosyne TaxID=213953 RepID=A0AAV1L1D0_9NEOP